MRQAIKSIALGAGSSQMIVLMASLAVTRLVNPASFGEFATASSLALVLATVSSLRLDLAVAVADSEAKALHVVRVAIKVSLLTSGLLALGLLLFAALDNPHDPFQGFCDQPTWMLPVVVGLGGLFSTLNQWTLRKKRYRELAIRNVIQAATTGVAQVFLSIAGAGAMGLMGGLALGQMVGVGTLVVSGRWELCNSGGGSIRAVFKDYRSHILTLTPSALINQSGLAAPLILGAPLFGHDFTGWFGLTQRSVGLPLSVLGAAVGQAVLGEVGAALRDGSPKATKMVRSAIQLLAGAAIVIAAILVVIGPQVFDFVFGKSYRESGHYARGLAAGLAMQLIASPLSVLLVVMGRVGFNLLWDTIRLASVSAVIWVAFVLEFNGRQVSFALGTTNAILYAVLLGAIVVFLRRTVDDSKIRGSSHSRV